MLFASLYYYWSNLQTEMHVRMSGCLFCRIVAENISHCEVYEQVLDLTEFIIIFVIRAADLLIFCSGDVKVRCSFQFSNYACVSPPHLSLQGGFNPFATALQLKASILLLSLSNFLPSNFPHDLPNTTCPPDLLIAQLHHDWSVAFEYWCI